VSRRRQSKLLDVVFDLFFYLIRLSSQIREEKPYIKKVIPTYHSSSIVTPTI